MLPWEMLPTRKFEKTSPRCGRGKCFQQGSSKKLPLDVAVGNASKKEVRKSIKLRRDTKYLPRTSDVESRKMPRNHVAHNFAPSRLGAHSLYFSISLYVSRAGFSSCADRRVVWYLSWKEATRGSYTSLGCCGNKQDHIDAPSVDQLFDPTFMPLGPHRLSLPD